MASAGRRSYWSALLALFVLAPAHAQVFTSPANPFSRAPAGTKPRRDRVQAGVYLALWEFSPIHVPGVQSEQLNADPSPLVTGDYYVTRSVSLGGWWNPFSGEITAKFAAGSPAVKVADTDASFWDLHATYYLPERWAKGWSVQGGFSHLRHNIDLIAALRQVGEQNFAVNASSLNLWLNKTQPVGARRWHGQRLPISLFGSLGYYPSTQFDRAANVILGGSVPIARRLNLSSSVWFNSLGHTNTRVTVGLAGSF